MRALAQTIVILLCAVIAGLIILGIITGIFAQPGGWKVFTLLAFVGALLAFAFEALDDRQD